MLSKKLFWLILPVLLLVQLACAFIPGNQVSMDVAVALTVEASGANLSVNEEPKADIPTLTPELDPTSTPEPTDFPTPTATPEPKAGDTQVSSMDNATLIYIPGGPFKMGTDKGSDSKNKPSHEVVLDAYWIDQSEITNGQYDLCVRAGKCTPPAYTRSVTRLDYFGNSDFDDYPVVYVTWYQAEAYCKWAGRELPTEAQWENAARGPNGYVYPWGNEMQSYVANFTPTKQDMMRVGSFPSGASPYGVFDMSGNVYEWVADWFDKQYYNYTDFNNPSGPNSGELKSVRGGSFTGGTTKNRWTDWEYYGSWDGYDWYISYLKGIPVKMDFNFQATTRFSWKPEGTNTIIGFRCAMPAQ